MRRETGSRASGRTEAGCALGRRALCLRRRPPRAPALAWRRLLTGLLLVAGLAALSTAPAHADPAEGDLRLSGGSAHHEGRLEIFYDNEWGTVCDDFFRMKDARVACRQLGYTNAQAYGLRERRGCRRAPAALHRQLQRTAPSLGARIPEPQSLRGGTAPQAGQSCRLKLSDPRGPLQSGVKLQSRLTKKVSNLPNVGDARKRDTRLSFISE